MTVIQDNRQSCRSGLLACLVAFGLLASGALAFETSPGLDFAIPGVLRSPGAMAFDSGTPLPRVLQGDMGRYGAWSLPGAGGPRFSHLVDGTGQYTDLIDSLSIGGEPGEMPLQTFSVAVPEEYRSLLDRRGGTPLSSTRPGYMGLAGRFGSVPVPAGQRSWFHGSSLTPSERLYGAAVPEITQGSTRFQYGLVGTAPTGYAPGWDADPSRYTDPSSGPTARWGALAFGGGESVLRGHYRNAKVDDDWTPTEGQGAAGVVQGMDSLGFAGKSDLFDGSVNRTQAAQFAGNEFTDWLIETEPVDGVVLARAEKTQELIETGDTASVVTNRAGIDRGRTHFAYTKSEHDIHILPKDDDPEGEAHTTAYVDTLDVSQGVPLNGTDAVLGYTRTRQQSTDQMTGEESPEITTTHTRVDQVKPLSFLNLGYNKTVTEVDDEMTPTTATTVYSLNELAANDHAKLQASLVTTATADNHDPEDDGVKSEVLTVQTPKDQRMWLFTDRLGITNALWQRSTNELDEETVVKGFGADAQALGFTVGGSYANKRVDTELNPVDQTTTTLGVSRPLSSRTALGVGQTEVAEFGTPLTRTRTASATQSVGDLALSLSRGVVSTRSGRQRPQTGFQASFREDQDAGFRAGLTLIDHADTYNAHGLYTREARASMPLGPVTVRGSFRDNPQLKQDGRPTAVEGEQRSVGVDVPIGPLAFTVDRVENPTLTRGNTEELMDNTATDVGVTASFGEDGQVSVKDRRIEDEEDSYITNSMQLDMQYNHDHLGLLSLIYVRNWADGGHGNLPLGDGYRIQYAKDIGGDTSLQLNLAKSFADIQKLTEGLPDRDTRVSLELKGSF